MKKKVLIVDDEVDIVKMLVFRINHAGYETHTALNGKEALSLLQKDPKFDVILLDLIMPVMDGYEFALTIKKIPDLQNIPIILLSASTDNLEEKSHKLHAQAKIKKPFDSALLLETIRSLTEEK